MQTFNKVYDRYDQAERAVRDIEAAGVPSADISVVANKFVADAETTSATAAGAETGAGIGAVVGGGVGVARWPRYARHPWIGARRRRWLAGNDRRWRNRRNGDRRDCRRTGWRGFV